MCLGECVIEIQFKAVTSLIKVSEVASVDECVRVSLCVDRWVDPLFWVGCRRPLEQNDVHANPRETDSEKLLTRFNR